MEELSLRQKVIKGGFWVFTLRIIAQIFSFLRLVILARLLAPEDFGLMGIALLFLATLKTFSETGFTQALIQKKRKIKDYLDTAWTILVLRGVILFLVLYFIAPQAVVFFNAPQAQPLVRIIAFSVLFQALTNIGIVYFQRNLEFSKQFFYQFSGVLADFVVAVSAALILRSAWALVFGLLAGGMVRMIVSYLIHPYRPKLDFNFNKAKKLFGFGKWILGSSILIFLVTQGDDIFVGKLLGVAALGFYQLAYRISNIPATEITHVISQVTFPTYSKLQKNISKLRRAYLSTLQLTVFLVVPLGGLIFILSPDFTKIFLGEKWLPMVPAMRVLCIFAMARAFGATNGSLFLGAGRPKIDTIIISIKLGLLAILIYPFTKKWGITGTALATTLPVFISQSYGASQVLIITQSRLRDIVRKIFPPFIGTFVMLVLVSAAKELLLPDILLFSIHLILAVAGYIGFMFFFSKLYKDYDALENIGIIVKELWVLKKIIFYLKFWKYKKCKKIIYALTPPPSLRNVGDHAQAVAIKKWLQDNFKDFKILEFNKTEVYKFLSLIKTMTNEQDLIFLHSGGNLGDRGLWSEGGRRLIIKNFPKNKIISLPQTIFFSETQKGQKELKKTREIYNTHQNLMIMARDEQSFELAKSYFPNCKILLCPDFVLSLSTKIKRNEKRKNILLCLRKDSESRLGKLARRQIKKEIRSLGQKHDQYDTTFSKDIAIKNREKEFKKALSFFRKYKLVITDRLHGVIFAVITQTPCIALKTVDHKLTASVRWFRGLNYIFYAAEHDCLPELMSKALKVKHFGMPDWKKRYFDNLKSKIFKE